MKQTLLILFLTSFTLQSWGFDHTITDKCRILMLEREIDPSLITINQGKNFYEPVFNREGTEDIILRTVNFGTLEFEGIYASLKDESVVHCWPSFSRVTGILLERNKFFYEPIGDENLVDAHKVHLHLHVDKGPGRIASKIETIYFVGKELKYVFFKEVMTGDTNEFPSPWFINYLNLEEAKEFMREYRFKTFEWHGQMYQVK